MTDEKRIGATVHGPVDKLVQIGQASSVTIQSDHVPLNPGPIWARLLGHLSQRAEGWLIDSKILSAPTLFQAEQAYLEWYIGETERKNRGDLVYIPLEAVPGPFRNGPEEWSPTQASGQGDGVRRIRQLLWLLKGEARGGDQALAQLAAARKASRLVRNVARFLEVVRTPVVLLGDPGSGKSTTLREVGIRIARRSLNRARGLIPIYVPLGRYQGAFDEDIPADILTLVQQSIPIPHAKLRDSILELVAERRLLILFDGMDEMERTVYAQRVRKLSEFAGAYIGLVRTVFACRTNDFLPTFRHRQIVLLPFTFHQILRYVQKNFPLPVMIEGVAHNARYLTRKLIDSHQLGDAVSNPLTLYLIRHFIVSHRRWPEGRNELFSFYLSSVLKRLRSYQNLAGEPLSDESIVMPSLAQLAFETARISGGVYLQMIQLRTAWGEAHANRVVEWGLRSGVLNIEYSPITPLDINTSTQSAKTLTDPDSIGFFHHRIQEFLCATHLASHIDAESSLDWRALVDSPRWQETLLYLASVRGERMGAMRILEASLDEVIEIYADVELRRLQLESEIAKNKKEHDSIKPTAYHPRGGAIYSAEDNKRRDELDRINGQLADEITGLRWSVPPERERMLADRAVLTARLLGEPKLPSTPISERIGNKLRDAVRQMAKLGRPTSQVKMLWSWKCATNLIPVDTIRAPARSEIRWVRDQAILAIGSLSAERKYGAANLTDEIFFDFATSTLITRSKTYFQASAGNLRQLTILLWTLGWYVLYGWLAIGMNSAYAWFMARAIPGKWLDQIAFSGILNLDATILVAASPVLLALMISSMFSRKIVRLHALLSGLLCVGIFGSALWTGHSIQIMHWNVKTTDNFILSGKFLIVALPIFITTFATFTLFLTCFLSAMLVSARLSEPGISTKQLLAVLEEQKFGDVKAIFWIAMLLICIWIIAKGGVYLSGFSSVVYILKFICVIFVCGMFLLIFVIIMVLLSPAVVFVWREARRDWQSFLSQAAITVSVVLGCVLALGCILLTIYGLGYILKWPALWFEKHLGTIGILVCIVIIMCMLGLWIRNFFWLLQFYLAQFLGRGLFGDALPRSPEIWLRQLEDGNRYVQAFMLSTFGRSQLRVESDDALLGLLTSGEAHVKAEPALTIYWRKRHELEESAKQDRVGRMESLSASAGTGDRLPAEIAPDGARS